MEEEKQIGCGYCKHESKCVDRIDALKKGISTKEKAKNCNKFTHYNN